MDLSENTTAHYCLTDDFHRKDE